MLTQEQAVEIRVMARRGEGVREIARQLGGSRNTVRRYLRDEHARRYGPRAPRPCTPNTVPASADSTPPLGQPVAGACASASGVASA